MSETSTAQYSMGASDADPAVAVAMQPTQAYREWSVRVREISRLPKRELVRRVREQGVYGDLARWSKDELISTLCPALPHEQMWESVVADRSGPFWCIESECQDLVFADEDAAREHEREVHGHE